MGIFDIFGSKEIKFPDSPRFRPPEPIEFAENAEGVFEQVGSTSASTTTASASASASTTSAGVTTSAVTTESAAVSSELAVTGTTTAELATGSELALTGGGELALAGTATSISWVPVVGWGVAGGVAANRAIVAAGQHLEAQAKSNALADYDKSQTGAGEVRLGQYENAKKAIFYLRRQERDGNPAEKPVSELVDTQLKGNKFNEATLTTEQIGMLKQQVAKAQEALKADLAKADHPIRFDLDKKMLDSASAELDSYAAAVKSNPAEAAKMKSEMKVPEAPAPKTEPAATTQAPPPVEEKLREVVAETPAEPEKPSYKTDMSVVASNSANLLNRQRGDDVESYATVMRELSGGGQRGEAEYQRIKNSYSTPDKDAAGKPVKGFFVDSKQAEAILKDIKEKAADPAQREELLANIYKREADGAMKQKGDSAVSEKDRAAAVKGVTELGNISPPTTADISAKDTGVRTV